MKCLRMKYHALAEIILGDDNGNLGGKRALCGSSWRKLDYSNTVDVNAEQLRGLGYVTEVKRKLRELDDVRSRDVNPYQLQVGDEKRKAVTKKAVFNQASKTVSKQVPAEVKARHTVPCRRVHPTLSNAMLNPLCSSSPCIHSHPFQRCRVLPTPCLMLYQASFPVLCCVVQPAPCAKPGQVRRPILPSPSPPCPYASCTVTPVRHPVRRCHAHSAWLTVQCHAWSVTRSNATVPSGLPPLQIPVLCH